MTGRVPWPRRLEALPGMAGHPLLTPGSPAEAAARAEVEAGRVDTSFVWPLGGRHAPQGHVRVTALVRPEEVPAGLTGLVVASPPGELHGLTPRQLVAQRTVAALLEHILVKLAAPTRTLAAVRAEREGQYVPSWPAAAPQHH